MTLMGTAEAEEVLAPVVGLRAMNRTDRRDERRIVRAAQQGDHEAIGQLILAHWDGAYRAALLIGRDRAAAEDIAQESFIAALRSIKRFDRRRPFGPWLHRIVTNRAIDHVRERERRGELLQRAGRENRPGSDEPDLSVELSAALERLTPHDRAIVVLRHLFDYRSDEIGVALDMAPGTVRRRLSEALRELRIELEKSR